MADKITLALEPRAVLGKKVARLRRSGILPATVYGKGVEPLAVQLDARAFQDVYRRAGRTGLVELEMPGQPVRSAFVHTLQRHPVSRQIIHADFRVVDLRTELTVSVPIHVAGASPLVTRGDAVLNQVLSAVAVRALPADIPSHVTVDISDLDSFDKTIHVRDIVAPEGATIETDGDELVASLTPARAEEEVAPAEAGDAAEPELVRERREDEEE